MAAAVAPDSSYLCHAYEKMYLSFCDMNEQDSTMLYLERCNAMSSATGMTDMYVQTLGDMAYFNEASDKEKAAVYNRLYIQAYDSLLRTDYNLRDFFRMRGVQQLYELDKTDRKISDLRREAEARRREATLQRRISYILIAAIMAFSVLMWIVVRQKMKIRDAYRNLFSVNQATMSENQAARRLSEGYRERISELENELARVGSGEDATPQKRKYMGSSLDMGRRREIQERVERVMERDKAFCDVDFSLSRLAEIVDSNQSYVSQVINETYSKNFNDFLNDYRIREACVRLLDSERYGNYTIAAIASGVGYKAQSTFIRAFRKNTGLSPSVYQKMARAER